MRLFLKIIIGLLVLYLLALIAFTYEENYRKVIRYLYEILSRNMISFQQPGKYFHFASAEFVFAFCTVITLLFFVLKNQNNRLRILNLILSFVVFSIVTIAYCFLDSFNKLAQCTACPDGTRILTYDVIQYDLLFILSLSISLIPSVVLLIKRKRASL
jgi:hypothetical protein